MKLYNFTRLITKYAVPFIVETDTVGSYDSGIYKPGAAETHDYTGAIVPMSERKQYQSGGTYTSQDRELYMFERIPEALRRGRVVYGNNVYNIESETITLPVNPTREKYIFMGWHEDPDFNDDVIAQIDTGTTGDKVFYAEWKKAPFVCESGKWLNIMGEKICMSETKPEGQPSLVVQMPQQQGKHYIMLINNSDTPIHEGSSKKLRVKIGNKTYNAYDASVDIE